MVMVKKVSTRRDLITFSSPVWELSGRNAVYDAVDPDDKPTGGPEPDGKWPEKWEPIDAMELVLGLCGLIVGADPDVACGLWLPPPGEKVTREPEVLLPLSPEPPGFTLSSPPSSDRKLRWVVTELVEILRLRFREKATSKSSDRWP